MNVIIFVQISYTLYFESGVNRHNPNPCTLKNKIELQWDCIASLDLLFNM